MSTLHVVKKKDSCQKRCELILHNEYRYSTFKILNANEAKHTFCYSMKYDISIISAYCCKYSQISQEIVNMIYTFYSVHHFVKIFEDQNQPIAFVQKLLHNTNYHNTLQNDLIIPEFATYRTDTISRSVRKYDIVQYTFVPHVTLQSIVIRMIQSKQLNPKYFIKNLKGSKTTPWKPYQYKLIMLYIFKRVIEIVINMHQLQLVDLDLSPDNFIIKTLKNGFAQWDEIIPQNCVKIDHESVIEFKNGSLYAYEMNKPMKAHCTPPEISGYDILHNPHKIINVEAFSVYQIASTIIMLLFGQVQINGIWNTLVIKNNRIVHETLQWNPKFDLFPDDLSFLRDCVSISPSKRPSFTNLLKYVFRSIEITKRWIESIQKASNTNNFPKKVARKTNNFNTNNNNSNNYRNDGQVRIIHNPQHSQNTQQSTFNNINGRLNYTQNSNQQRNFVTRYQKRGRFEITSNKYIGQHHRKSFY